MMRPILHESADEMAGRATAEKFLKSSRFVATGGATKIWKIARLRAWSLRHLRRTPFSSELPDPQWLKHICAEFFSARSSPRKIARIGQKSQVQEFDPLPSMITTSVPSPLAGEG